MYSDVDEREHLGRGMCDGDDESIYVCIAITRDRLREEECTFAPFSANNMEVARPIPLPAPVTTHTISDTFILSSSSFFLSLLLSQSRT
jgi:hypothetical protein